ncbi:MAG: hypothetical protein ACMXYK_04495 [Candidatus Woesearchaeota archaeon]
MVPDPTGNAPEITFSGYYSWKNLYATLTKWYTEQELEIFETVFKDKTSGSGFTERELEWEGSKEVDRMNKFYMKVAIKIWDSQVVEVTENGTTKKMDRGRLRVRITAEIEDDWQGLFSGSNFKQTMGNLYRRLIKWDWGFNEWDYWMNKQYELRDAIRNTLGMET